MNPLISLSLAASIGLGTAVWQQHRIGRLQTDTVALARQLQTARAELRQAQARADELSRRQTTAPGGDAGDAVSRAPALPTAKDEGRWPEKKPYFYLPKTSLAKVRFRDRTLPAEELDAGQRQRVEAGYKGTFGVQSQLFQPLLEIPSLNPNMTLLLGMTDAEVREVNAAFQTLFRWYRDLEAESLEPVEPPQTVPRGQRVAHLPALAGRMASMVEFYQEHLADLLGEERGKLLHDQTLGFATEQLDQFGQFPRDFVRSGDMLLVFTKERGFTHENVAAWSLSQENHPGWLYHHLFGSGSRCELK